METINFNFILVLKIYPKVSEYVRRLIMKRNQIITLAFTLKNPFKKIITYGEKFHITYGEMQNFRKQDALGG